MDFIEWRSEMHALITIKRPHAEADCRRSLQSLRDVFGPTLYEREIGKELNLQKKR